MLTLRPYGAWAISDALNYKHCVPTGLVLSRERDIPAIVICFMLAFANGSFARCALYFAIAFATILPDKR
jgi:hypothetical protein